MNTKEIIKCKICNKDININALGSHLRIHNINSKKYHLKYINSTASDNCKICNTKTKWLGVYRGWRRYCKKCSNKIKPSCIEYWIYEKEMNIDKAKIAVKKFQILVSKRRIEYWIKLGYSIQESKKLLSEYQRRDEKWFLNQYDNGKEKWENYKKRQGYTNTLQYFIEKYGEIVGKKKYSNKFGYNSFEELMNYNRRKEYTQLFFNIDFRKEILERQNYVCGNPDCFNKKNDVRFDLHHIDYDKSNDDKNNLIFLCIHCHTKTNFNREKWKKILTEINNEEMI